MSGNTIYHDPYCGTSRDVLVLIRTSGPRAHPVDYLKDPPCRPSKTVLGILP